MAIRYDTAKFSKVRSAPGGGIRVDAALTRTGVFLYKNPDGSERRELRPQEEVFSPESIESFKGAPVTIGHQGAVTAETWATKAVGHVGEDVRADQNLAVATVTIQKADAISQVRAGSLVELSCGYSVDLDETPGEFEGQKYDAIQRNIRGNHVALGPAGWGRAGSSVALRLDGDQEPVACTTLPLMQELDTLLARVKELESRSDALQAEKDVLQARVKELEDPARMDGLVAARVHVLDQARKVLGTVPEGLSELELKVKVIQAKNKAFVQDGKSAEYISAAFDMALSLEAPPVPALGLIRVDAAQPLVDRLKAAQVQHATDARDAWKAPGTITRKS